MFNSSPLRHRRATRRGLVAGVAAALLAPLVGVQPAGAGPAIDGHLAAAVGTTIEDHSTEMPRTSRNEVTGDFLGMGYHQRAVVESGSLNIYDAAFKGGALLKSTPTDLFEPTGDQLWNYFLNWWKDIAKASNWGRIQLAWAPDTGFVMGGVKAHLGEHMLYGLPSDGSCAKQSCARWAINLPQATTGNACKLFDNPQSPNTCYITTSALAVGHIGTRPMIAVGLSGLEDWPTGPDGKAAGIWIVDPTNGSVLSRSLVALSRDTTTPVTALDWDDHGSGLLAFGVFSDTRNVYAVKVEPDGTIPNPRTWWDVQLGMAAGPQSIAIGHRPDGSPVIAFGLEGGGVKLWDPAVTSANKLAEWTGSTDSIDALTFTDRIDGSTGVPDLVAVGSRNNSGQVLRWDGRSTTLEALPVAPNGGTKTDVGGIRAWFAGYKTGSVQFVNQSTSDDFELDFATRPNAAFGCWFAQDFEDRAALPNTAVDVEAGQSSAVYALAAFTTGSDGGCAATDFTGQWAAYVTVTPKGRPADRTVAKLVISRSGQLTVQSVGGGTKLVATKQTNPADPHPLGKWTIAIQSPGQPTPPSKLTITGTQLDPAGTTKPVYRFDVPATSWTLPVSTPPRADAVLAPLQVRGTTANGTDVSLGLLVPQGKPSRATSGTVTLSKASFYWQNPDVGQQITDIYVNAGSTSSAKVNLAGLDAKAPAAGTGTPITEVVVCPAVGTSKCDANADPFANGLDQAPLRIQLHYTNSNQKDAVLDSSDPAYSRVYYRDENGDLLTGLIPEDGSAYTRVSPWRGAYSNDGSTTTCTTRCPTTETDDPRFSYLSTTTTNETDIYAYVGGSAEVSDEIIVKAIDFAPTAQRNVTASSGFYVTGCADYSEVTYCRIASITATTPGLFLTHDPDTGELRIGLQFASSAQTSPGSLPLQQVAGQAEHNLAAKQLTINNGEVTLTNTAGFQPADTIDTWLITHGTQILVTEVQVG
jgi:hypothetical protein